MIAKNGVDIRAALVPFFQRRLPEELEAAAPTSAAFVAALLRELRGAVSMESIARRTRLSRSSISRILAGRTEPKLAVFLQLVDVMTRRVLDLLSGLCDIASVEAARSEWQRLTALRRLASDNPLSEAVPRFLELEQYARLSKHREGWIADKLGISREEERATLHDLAAAGTIRWDGAKWRPDKERSVDTSRLEPAAAARLRVHWTERARRRIEADGEGIFSYLVFGADEPTLAAIAELRLRFFREVRALVAASPAASRVYVANVHLFPIDVGSV